MELNFFLNIFLIKKNFFKWEFIFIFSIKILKKEIFFNIFLKKNFKPKLNSEKIFFETMYSKFNPLVFFCCKFFSWKHKLLIEGFLTFDEIDRLFFNKIGKFCLSFNSLQLETNLWESTCILKRFETKFFSYSTF